MLYATYDSDNEFVVSLYGKCNNVINPNFIWVLTHSDSNSKYVINMTDNSPSPYYYNSFTFSSGTSYKIGQYEYDIYETSVTGSTDISGLSIIKTGILNISGTYSSTIRSFTQSNSRVIKSFRN